MLKPKILCLSSLWQTFIHQQVVEIINSNKVDIFTNFHINLYSYLQNSIYRTKIRDEIFSKHIPNDLYNLTFYPGFTKNILSQYHADLISIQLSKFVKSNNFDLIHAHTVYPSGYVAYKLSRKYKIPFIVTTHGMDFYQCSPNVSENTRGKQYNSIILNKINKVLLYAEQIIAVSERFRKDILEYNSKAKVISIENGYYKELFKTGSKTKARKELGLSENDKILLSVGYFVKKKGHKYLIEAMDKIIQSFPNAKLYLVGGGMLKSEYIKLIKSYMLDDYVFLIDNVSQHKLARWYQAADVFVFPSLDEPFGVALIEAMACGIPTIATKTQGPSQIIHHNEDGILIPIKDTKSIEENVCDLFSNPSKLNEIGQKASKNILSTYGYKEKEIIELYLEILK